jgi:hypothetical protein
MMQTWNRLAVVIAAALIATSICASPAFATPGPPCLCGFGLAFNIDFTNTTGSIADDFHIKLSTSTPVNVLQTFEGGAVSFNPGTITGDGTTTVEIDWSGATVNPGQTTHIGASASSGSVMDVTYALESWWTHGGQKIGSHGYDGAGPTVAFTGAASFAPNAGWTVARVTLFTDLAGTNVVGTEWVEEEGDFARIFNASPYGPIFASVATLSSPDPIPLEDLNFSLTGFGLDGPIMQLDPVPEPGTVLLIITGLMGCVWRRTGRNM